MNALTLWEPWATLIACRAKRHETRSWRPPGWAIGRPIAIHAARRTPERHEDLDEILRCRGIDPDAPNAFGCGEIVAVGVLWSAMRVTHSLREEVSRDDLACGDWSSGRWAWEIGAAVRLKPIPARGRQGIWQVDPVTAARIEGAVVGTREA